MHYCNNTGTTLIAAVNSGRHCVTVESSSLQYIWAKVHAVKSINPTTVEDEAMSSEQKNEAKGGNNENDKNETGNEDKDE